MDFTLSQQLYVMAGLLRGGLQLSFGATGMICVATTGDDICTVLVELLTEELFHMSTLCVSLTTINIQ